MEIRKINNQDKIAIQNLYQQLYPTNDGWRFNFENLEDNIIEIIPLCLVENDQIKGFLLGIYYNFVGKSLAYIEDLIIESNSRGQGYGSSLIKEFEQIVKQKGVQALFVQTDPDEGEGDPSQFYIKNGYSLIKSPGLVKTFS